MELASAGEIRDGLTRKTAPHQRIERFGRLARKRLAAVRREPRAIAAQDMREQYSRLRRIEARCRKRA